METLRTVLTQKIQSEAQTVCSLTHYVGYLESVSIIKDFNVSIILESTIGFSVFCRARQYFIQQSQQVLSSFGEE